MEFFKALIFNLRNFSFLKAKQLQNSFIFVLIRVEEKVLFSAFNLNRIRARRMMTGGERACCGLGGFKSEWSAKLGGIVIHFFIFYAVRCVSS